MHRSLGASLKQLTRFFNVQKNLSFSLKNNNIINTYIHPNDQELIRSELISLPLIYSVTFSEFNENNSLNQKNNYSMSSSSDYISFNSLFNPLVNSPSKLTSLNSPLTLFSSVLSQHGSEQHLDSATVFSPLSSLSLDLSHSLKVDSPCTESEF
jgi:hypothetical protein